MDDKTTNMYSNDNSANNQTLFNPVQITNNHYLIKYNMRSEPFFFSISVHMK
jgi:hypothetical protein